MPEDNHPQVVEFHGLKLDKFQIDAFEAIHHARSVVVSAPTGSGKTLIADYIIHTDIKKGKRVIYTAPIKALSNQKYLDFSHEYGADKIGILTGDVVINPKAPVLIMTTEVYRNMALVSDPVLDEVSYVIFDEIHYINDIERGYIWEESIIFSPDHVRFLCLSATIPNSSEFASWIKTIKGHPIDVIKHHKRSVPLKHSFYDQELGITSIAEIRKKVEEDRMPRYEELHGRRRGRRGARPKKRYVPPPDFIDVVEEVKSKGDVPAIFFVFSRSGTQKKAGLLSKKKDFLSKEEKAEVVKYVREELSKESTIETMKTTRLLRDTLAKGIGFHHAGMLPRLKSIVEHLFARGLVKMLIATETFAVGVNFPAKAVIFDSLEKYDGQQFRYLNSKEYFQIAGRAGRRGIDTHGTVISLIHRQFADLKKIERFTARDVDPIISQFKLSINTVLNMIRGHSHDEIGEILRSNFGQFQKYGAEAIKTGSKAAYIKGSFVKKKRQLEGLGYVKDDKLTPKGEFACYIFAHELVITELFFEEMGKSLTPFDMVLMVAAVMYEPRKANRFKRYKGSDQVEKSIDKVMAHPYLSKKIDPRRVKQISVIVEPWFMGEKFVDVMKNANLLEGDLIRLFRQVIDMLNQVKKATHDLDMVRKIDKGIDAIDREFVEVEFE